MSLNSFNGFDWHFDSTLVFKLLHALWNKSPLCQWFHVSWMPLNHHQIFEKLLQAPRKSKAIAIGISMRIRNHKCFDIFVVLSNCMVLFHFFYSWWCSKINGIDNVTISSSNAPRKLEVCEVTCVNDSLSRWNGNKNGQSPSKLWRSKPFKELISKQNIFIPNSFSKISSLHFCR